MIYGASFDDSRPQAPFYNPPEPQFECAGSCGYHAWTPDEMLECIVCKRRFCADCLIAIGPEKYCQDHAKCKCGEPAIVACDDCGDLICAAHLAERIDPDRTRDLCFPMCAIRTPDSPERLAMIAECDAFMRTPEYKNSGLCISIPGRLPDRPGPRMAPERKPAEAVKAIETAEDLYGGY